MARKDVIAYYLQQQSVYLRMVGMAKAVDEDYRKGLISREELERLQERLAPSIGQIRDNYERLSYIVLLLNEPGRKSRKAKFRRQNGKLYGRLVAVGKENSLREDADALAVMKGIIEEERRNGSGQGD